jgi:hypothetical protein
MRPRSFVIGLLVEAILALAPLAHASPPDQTWIPGLYDNADYDDVVSAATAVLASLELWPVPALGFRGTVVDLVEHLDECAPAPLTTSSNQTRAPPPA